MAVRELCGEHVLLRIFVGESELWEHRPLYRALIEKLRHEGLSGATALRGIEGFGASNVLHSTSLLALSRDLPVLVEVVDSRERIDRVLPALREMVGKGLMTTTTVNVVKYAGGAEPPDSTPT